ncbi:CcmD-like small membrane protein [Wolbachia endosymbiont of Howardula sp.]
MNQYVLIAYLMSCILMMGELIFTFSCYIKSKKMLKTIKQNNEEKT